MRTNRRWFKFRLRTLLLFVLMCGLGLGGLWHENQQHRQQMAAVSAIREAGGIVEIEQSGLRWLLHWIGHEYEGTLDRVVRVDFTKLGGDDLNGPATTLVKAAAAAIPRSFAVDSVRHRQAKSITDQHLEILHPLDDLESLNLFGASVTDSGIAQLIGMRRLRALTLSGKQITDETLKHLKAIGSLEALGLQGAAITDEGLRHLVEMPNLKYLNLSHTDITDEAMKHLRRMSQLEELVLRKTAITGENALALHSLQRLRRLDASRTKISNPGLSMVADIASLEELDLSGSKVTSQGMDQLAGLIRLRRLNLSHLRISETGCAALTSLMELEELQLSDTRANDAGLRHLASLPRLRHVSLFDSTSNYHLNVTSNGVAELRARNPALTVSWNGPQNFSGYSR